VFNDAKIEVASKNQFKYANQKFKEPPVVLLKGSVDEVRAAQLLFSIPVHGFIAAL
jgi:hypothetical protein